jgi:hypothetical protein
VDGDVAKHLLVEEKAVSTCTGEMSGDGGVRDSEFACDLAEAGAGDGESGDAGEQFRAMQPEGGSECLFGEAASAGGAGKPLLWPASPALDPRADAPEPPVLAGSIEAAAAVGTMGWSKVSGRE